jgi:predicted phosphate transport protein (TIGR00153 family)
MLNLIPRDEAFFAMLDASAKNALLAARQLRNLFEDFRDAPARVKEIRELEHEGDKITHKLLDKLDRTFIVPIDREDLYALSRGLDDVVDAIYLVADQLLLYRIDRPTSEAISLARILVRCCEQVDSAMPLLATKSRIREVQRHCSEIDRLENLADRLQRDALMKLFDDPQDVMEVIKWKEFYQVLETAIDNTENVADLLRGIVLKAV